VNRFHSNGNVAPVSPRGGPVMVAGTTVQPLRPVAVGTTSRSHQPGVGVVYTAPPTMRSGVVTAPVNGFADGQAAMRPVYVPAQGNGMNGMPMMGGVGVPMGGRATMPASGAIMPGGRPTFSGGSTITVNHGSMGGTHSGGASVSSGGGSVHSGGGASFGGGGGGAVHSGGGSSGGGGGGSSHH